MTKSCSVGVPEGCESFRVKVTKLTSVDLMRRACEMTMHGETSKTTLARMYDCEHSPIRTQIFWLELLNVPTFVSVHFVRHKVGVEHFVTSNRDDRGGIKNVDRYSLVNHGMLVNAQALINMARKRLCGKAHVATKYVMCCIVEAVKEADSELAKFLVPECVYRGNVCHELRSCGILKLGQVTE